MQFHLTSLLLFSFLFLLLLSLLVSTGHAKNPCKDFHGEKCQSWANEGACDSNQEFMHDHCKKSCGLCDMTQADSVAHVVIEEGEELYSGEGGGEEEDYQISDASSSDDCQDNRIEECPEWNENDDCRMKGPYMLRTCRKTCNVCHLSSAELDSLIDSVKLGVPQLMGPNEAERISQVMRDAEETFDEMVREIGDMEEYMTRYGSCRNRDPNCAYWAAKGYCGATVYMQENCGPVCRSC